MISIPRCTTAITLWFSVNSRTMTEVSAISRTHDHDTYTGHFPLRLLKFTPTCLAFEITRATRNYVEVTYELDAKSLDDVQRIIHIIFGLQS